MASSVKQCGSKHLNMQDCKILSIATCGARTPKHMTVMLHAKVTNHQVIEDHFVSIQTLNMNNLNQYQRVVHG